jgi:DNA-binding MarR family transcriptional regulator
VEDDRIQHAVALLRDVLHIVQDRVRPLLLQEELGLTHLAVLRHVARHGPCSHAAVSSALGLTPGSLTPILQQLEKKGWILRRPDAADRRRVLVEITPRASKRLKRLMKQAPALVGDLFQDLTGAELAAFTSMLERIRARGANQNSEATSR